MNGDILKNNPHMDAAFLAASLHSRRVNFFKRVLPVIAIIIAGVFSWVTFFVAPPSTDIVTLNSEADIDNKLVMIEPKVEGYTSANQPYALRSSRAIQDPERAGMIDLEDIDAIMPLGGRGSAHILAQGGTFDNINGRILLGKPFQIKTDTGIIANFLSADINITTSQLISNEPVEIKRQGEDLTAQKIRILDEGQVFVFEGKVRLIIAKQHALE